jgi:hypothetical protein
MTNQHPATPTPQEIDKFFMLPLSGEERLAAAFCAGADQELAECCALLPAFANYLRDERRPKPPTLKEQALKGLKEVGDFTLGQLEGCRDFNEFKTHVDNIHRALGALPND